MRKCRKAIALLSVGLLLFGCGGSDEEESVVSTKPVNEGDYRIAIPFQSSNARQTHVEFNNGREVNIDAVGEGLLRYSKERFSTSSYYLQEGQILDRDTLQVGTTLEDKEGILGFKSAENPYGLNPEKGSSIPVSSSVTIEVGTAEHKTIPVIDVFEVNFIQDLEKDAEIKGISLAIILNPTIVDATGATHTIADEQLKTLGEEAARFLFTYVKSLPSVASDTPIMIALFRQDSSDTTLAGSFFASGYGEKSIDQFDDIDEKWVIFSSDEAAKLDGQISSQFDAVKKALFQYLPNDIGMVGKGLFIDNQLDQLQIDVTTRAKTHTENVGVVQYIRELLANFTSSDYAISVRINADLEYYAMLSRSKGSSDTSVIMY